MRGRRNRAADPGRPVVVRINELSSGDLRLDVELLGGLFEPELHPGVDGDALLGLGQLGGAVGRHLGQLVSLQVLDSERPEHVVDDRVGHLDVRMALDHAPRLERLERERVDELVERHAVLEALGDGDGEARQDAAQRRPLLGQVDEHLAERPVVVLAGAEEHLVAADAALLGVATAARRQQEPGPRQVGVRLGR